MKNQLVRSRRHEEVRGALLSIANALDGLGDQHACILHCLQPHRSNFYRQLEREFSVRVLPCYPTGGLKLIISRVALGVSALIVIDHYDRMPLLFSRIGEQAMAALYAINRSMLASVPSLAQLNASEIVAAIQKDPAHLIYQVDEDSTAEGDQVVELVNAGADCPQVLRDAVALWTVAT